MRPISFPEHNRVLDPPKPDEVGGNEDIASMPIFSDGKVCISCWQLTEEEVTDLIKTGKLYVLIFSGCFQPPMAMSTVPPFVSETEPEVGK